jgi:hypothetical protein
MSQDVLYQEAAGVYGAALERLAGSYEADRDKRLWIKATTQFAGASLATLEVQIIRLIIISLDVRAVAAIPLNLVAARRYQRQIDQLARLQEEH